MLKSHIRIAVFLMACALLSVFVMNALNGYTLKTSLTQELLPDGGSFADRHAERAVHLLNHGTLGDEVEPFLGGFARGPVEAVEMAASFLLFGKSMWSFWAFQMIFFVAAVLLLYVCSLHLMGETRWAVLPPLMLALFWGTSLYVFSTNNETMCLFLVGLFLYGYIRFSETMRYQYLFLSGVAISVLVLAKPIFEYILPVFILYVLYVSWQKQGQKGAVKASAVFFAAVFLIVGGWHIRNAYVLGTPKISAGGHALLIHSTSALYSGRQAAGFIIASFLGDLTADKIFPGYALLGEPRASSREIFNHRRANLRRSGLSEFDTDKIFFAEALGNIRRHPLMYSITVPGWFLRLNSPPDFRGGMIDRMFVDTYQSVPTVLKLSALIVGRLMWYVGFIGLALWAVVRRLISPKEWATPFGLMALFILYSNAVYSLLAHAEVRYLVVALPFYFIFFTDALQNIIGRFLPR